MLTVPQKAAEVQKASEQLLQQACDALGDSDQLFRDEGLDPEKARGVLASLVTPEVEAEARAQLEQIKHDIARDREDKRAELGLTSEGRAVNGTAKRPRPMV